MGNKLSQIIEDLHSVEESKRIATLQTYLADPLLRSEAKKLLGRRRKSTTRSQKVGALPSDRQGEKCPSPKIPLIVPPIVPWESNRELVAAWESNQETFWASDPWRPQIPATLQDTKKPAAYYDYAVDHEGLHDENVLRTRFLKLLCYDLLSSTGLQRVNEDACQKFAQQVSIHSVKSHAIAKIAEWLKLQSEHGRKYARIASLHDDGVIVVLPPECDHFVTSTRRGAESTSLSSLLKSINRSILPAVGQSYATAAKKIRRQNFKLFCFLDESIRFFKPPLAIPDHPDGASPTSDPKAPSSTTTDTNLETSADSNPTNTHSTTLCHVASSPTSSFNLAGNCSLPSSSRPNLANIQETNHGNTAVAMVLSQSQGDRDREDGMFNFDGPSPEANTHSQLSDVRQYSPPPTINHDPVNFRQYWPSTTINPQLIEFQQNYPPPTINHDPVNFRHYWPSTTINPQLIEFRQNYPLTAVNQDPVNFRQYCPPTTINP